MKDLRRIFHAAAAERDHPWGLATLVKTQGSSYRQPGTRLLIYPDGHQTIGFLSGGCLEQEIARHACGVMNSGIPQLRMYDTRQLFGCDGCLWVYLENIPAAGTEGNILTRMADLTARRAMCRVMVPYLSGKPSELLPDNALVVEREGTFLQRLPPLPQLIIFGNGPEMEPLAFFAAGLGWTFRQYSHPDELPENFASDASTAAVVMTHKFGRDLAALSRLFPLKLPYIGLMGSRKRHQELLRRFAEFHGDIPPEWFDTLHAPAGLDTGSESPEEIAMSIVAEAAAVLAGRQGGFLKQRNSSIHRMEVSA